MKLWLLRHGEAQPYQRKDAERQLTEHGRKQVAEAAQNVAGHKFTHVLCSPYIRARQTAEIFLPAVDYHKDPEIVPWLTPESSVAEAQRYLASYTEDSLLLIGHQPLLGNLVGWFCDGSAKQAVPLGTATLVQLEGDCLAAAMNLLSVQHIES